MSTSTIDIKNLSGATILSAITTEDAISHEELMNSDYIQLSWNSNTGDTLPAGAYIMHGTEKYSLLEPYTPTRADEAEYQYTPQFQSRIMGWQKHPVPIYTYADDGITVETREFDWEFTGSPADAMYMVQQAIKNETGETWTAQLSDSLPATISISSQSGSIFSVLNDIANQCETEWWGDKATNTLYLSQCKHGTAIPLSVGGNVKAPSVTSSKDGYFTRFYVFGSSRNVTQDISQGAATNSIINKRLTLDPATYPGGYIDAKPNMQQGEIFTTTLYYDDIYPSSKLAISDVRSRLKYRLDSSGNKIQTGADDEGNPVYEQYAIWYFQIADFSFDPETIIEGMNLSVSFETGQLAGRDFELAYHDKTETVNDGADVVPFNILAGDFEIILDESTGTIIPGLAYIIPQEGDQVILYNIEMPAEYTASARQELAETAQKDIAKRMADNNSYEFDSNPVDFYENDTDLALGQAVTFSNGEISLSTRVLMVEKHLDSPCRQRIRVGNEIIKGNTQQLREEVTQASQNIDILAAFNELSTSLQNTYGKYQREMAAWVARINGMWRFDPNDPTAIYSDYGVYSNSFISAKGKEDESGGTPAGATKLSELTDVSLSTLSNGQALVYDLATQKWVNKVIETGGIDEEELAAYLTENNYAKKSDIPSLDGYATEAWVTGKNYATVSDLDSRIDALVNGAPAAFDTLKEIADVLQDNVDSIGDILTALGNKVDKVAGKGLSSNDFTDALLAKLNGIEAGANKYVLPTATGSVLGGVKVGATLAIASGVLNMKAVGIAGTYTKVTVDAYGRVTGHASLAATDIPSLDWSKITSGKPTTLAGYGITDGVNDVSVTGNGNVVSAASISGHTLTLTKGVTAVTTSRTVTAGYGLTGGGALSANITLNIVSANAGITVNADNIQLNTINALTSTDTVKPLSAAQGKVIWDFITDLFEKVNIGTSSAPVWAIRAKYGLYTESFLSAKGANPDSGGTVVGVTALSELTDVSITPETLSNNDMLRWNGSKWVAVAMADITPDLSGYATQAWVTSQKYLTTVSIATITDLHSSWDALLKAQKPSTLAGYGITDGVNTVSITGSGNVITTASISGHTLTLSKGITALTSVSIATISDLHSSWDAVLKAQKPAWLTTVSLATISDLHASWDALLKAAPSAYVTRWPAWSEVTSKPTWIGANKPSYAFSEITGKPTTLSGYGIMDAYTKTESNANYFYKSIYAPDSRGCLVQTDIAANSDTMVTVVISGNNYYGNSKPLYSLLNFYNYQSGNSIINISCQNVGFAFGDIKIFNYGGYVCLWLPYHHNFMSYSLFIFTTNHYIYRNRVTSITNAAVPSSVTRLVTVTPKQTALTSDNVYSATQLQTARTIWGQSFNGTANVSGNMTGVGSITMSGNIITGSSFNIGKSGAYTLIMQSGGSTILNSSDGYNLMFGYRGTNKIVFYGGVTSGNDLGTCLGLWNTTGLGIGTTSPSYKLHVAGTSYFSGAVTAASAITASGEIKSSSANAFRLSYGNYGVIVRNDGSSFFLLTTAGGQASSGHWNSLRPFSFSLTTGRVIMENGLGVSTITASGLITANAGVTTSQYIQIGSGRIKWDSTNNALYVEKSDGTAIGFYSNGWVSAKGANDDSGTGGGGSSYSRLDSWDDYDSSKSGWVLSALLGNDLNTRVESLEAGSALSLTTTGSGNVVTAVSKSGTTLTVTKGITAALSTGTNATGSWPISIQVKDIRDTSPTPNDKVDRAVDFWFNNTGKPGSSPWYSGMTVKGWTDGYAVWQIASDSSTALSDSNLYFRSGVGTSWNAWKKVLDSTNYTGTLDSRYVTLSTAQTISGAKTFTSYISFKYDTDSSRVYSISFKNTSSETMGAIGYHNTAKNFFINPIGSTDPWADSVGKYSLFVGNNKLTYNTYPILHSANYTNYTVTKTGGGASGTWNINVKGYAQYSHSGSVDCHRTFIKNDNHGYDTFLLIADCSLLYTDSSNHAHYGFVGDVIVSRTTGYVIANTGFVSARIGHSTESLGIYSTTRNVKPCIVKYNSKYYIAFRLYGSSFNGYLRGLFYNTLSTFTQLNCPSSSALPDGLTIVTNTQTYPLNAEVDSADKLTTARTINGTSFDGTANITTAKWGTARNIYIRDASQAHTGAAVSVDGSANEYLLLPSTITATLSGNASTASKWATARTITLTGAVTGSVSIDGSGNVSLATTYATGNISALDSRYVNVSGDTMTGNLTAKWVIASNNILALGDNVYTNGRLAFEKGVLWLQSSQDGKIQISGRNGSELTDFNIQVGSHSVATINDSVIWTAGNDGSGSGLDADLLDGQHLGALANQVTKNFIFPNFESFGTATDNASYYTNIEKWVQTNYSGKEAMFFGRGRPNVMGILIGHKYDSAGNTDGFPRYCSFLYSNLGGVVYTFGTNNYTQYSYQLARVTDNVASATQLKTARTLWGQSFNGTANVSGNMTGVGNIEMSNIITFTSNNLVLRDANGYNVVSRDNTAMYVQNNAGKPLYFGFRGTSVLYFYAGSTEPYTAGSNVGAWNTTGLGIGTTSPSYKLHVAGTGYFSGAVTAASTLTVTGAITGNSTIYAKTGMYSDGYVSAKGQNQSSDIRLKNILSNVRLKISDIAKAPLFRFAWKSNPGMVEVGSSAQYWKNVLPDAVKERDGYLEMGYGNIALAGVITIAREVETLEQRVDRLEKENKNLKKKIKELERRAA